MDTDALNEALLAHTGSELTLAAATQAYLDAVRHSAGVIGVQLAGSELTGSGAGVALSLVADPELAVTWGPDVGWAHNGDREWPAVYRVSEEADAAGVMPAPDLAAAWLSTLAAGDRSGHPHPPGVSTTDDGALLRLLATYGGGDTERLWTD